MDKEYTDPEENWNNKWKEILLNPDGSVNIEQLKLELIDFDNLICRMIDLTYEVSGGILSYATYPVNTILRVKEEQEEISKEYQKQDDLVDGICSLCEREFDV